MLKESSKQRVRIADGYLRLVMEFPLRRIRTRKEHEEAVRFLADLGIRGQKQAGVEDYIETLAQLIDDYEKDAGLKLDLSHLTPVDALRHLMDAHGMGVSALGRIVGSQGTLSEVLAGRRELSKAMIRKLSAYFGVSPALFL
jgi:HTH-type transcriptional regulator / antitoxin HigA